MPYQIIGNQKARGLEWAIPRLGPTHGGNWDKASCLILEKDGDITACAVYNHWYPKTSVEISIASVGGNWLTRPFLTAVFRTPFVEWEMRRVGSSIAANNQNSIRFCEHLGFIREGRIREAAAPGVDLIILGMLKSECRFLGREYEGQRTASTRPSRDSERTGCEQ